MDETVGRGYIYPVKTLQARVKGGRLVVDQPTKLPEGTVVDLVVADEGDELDDEERAALHDALEKSWENYQAGKLHPFDEVLAKLR